MQTTLRVWLLLALLVEVRFLTAQNTVAESITIADGLSQGMIYDIEQSHDGFMWFATKDGLNRYDGYRFEVFTNDPFNPFSIAGNDIHRMFEDSRGNLWLSIDGKGLDVLEKQSGRFLHLPLEVPPFVTETDDGTIWVGTNKHLLRLHWRGTQPYLFDSANLDAYVAVEQMPIKLTAQYPAIEVEAEADGPLLIATDDGLFRYHPASSQLTLLVPNVLNIQCRTDKGVWTINRTSGVWFVEKGGSPRQVKIDLLPPPYFKTRIMADGNGNLIVACTSLFNGSGFFRVSEDELVQHGEAKRFEKVLWFDLFSPWAEVDRSGNLWAGTSGYGLRKASLTILPFRHLMPGVSIKQISSFNHQVCVPDILDGDLFMLESATILSAKTMFPGFTSLLWLTQANNGTTTHLLCHLDGQNVLGIAENGETRFLKLPFPLGNTGFMYLDPKGRGWISAVQGLLMCYLPEKDRFVTFDLAEHLGSLPLTYAVYEDARHDIWVGTDNGAVKLEIGNLDLEKLETTADGVIKPNFKILKFQTIATDPQSLRHNFVTAFCPDPHEPERYLWLSTKGGGLNLLDLATNKFEHFTARNSGLPNDVVYGILTDDQDNIWGSTNRGLFRLTIGPAGEQKRSYRFRNFRAFDGLQGDEFNTHSYFKGKNGQLYFGGVGGLTTFDPAAIVDRQSDAMVRLTGLKINNLDINYAAAFIGEKEKNNPLDRPIHLAEALLLDHTQNTVTFDFALMDFVNPNENRYRYRLLGMDGDWVEAGVTHSAPYTGLSPGSYTFEVQGAISGGEWSTSTALKIKILPPWWKSWWAYSLYALALGTAVYLFYKNRLQQRLEQQEALRLRELDGFKSRFFTNITHEFRTPLTVILGNLEIMKLEIGKQVAEFPIYWRESSISQFLISKISMTRRNAESLLRLINQILDLAKLESNSLKINYINGDVLPYLRYISESLHSFANAQNVMLRVESSETQIVMDYDPERLLQIVHNLLSNAIKFTPSGGRVTLFAGMRDEESGMKGQRTSSLIPHSTSLVLTVSDTGVGISPEDLPLIFDRFYQANNQVPPLGGRGAAGGTGIGLALTRELVKAMDGEITVKSELSKGTTFTVRLPIVQSPPEKSGQALTPKGEPHPGSSISNSAEFDGLGSPKGLRLLAKQIDGQEGLSHEGTPYILLIEDNPDVVEYLASCLSGEYQLDFAYNGRAGIEKALETVPDLIVSDVMMPEKDGFEVCDFLKNDERTSHIPIVLLTAKADVESRLAGLKRGADAYLAKPFHREELLVTLANLLEIRKKLRARYSTLPVLSPGKGIAETAPPSSLIPPPSHLEDVFLQKLRHCIEENMGESTFDGPALAKKMNMSEVQLYRKIKALTDKSTAIFIRSVRLARGKELLQTTDLNVSEIAYEVGFDDPNYFSRTFSQEYGAAPSDMRK